MRIVKCELVRLQTPFRRTFKHAAAARSHGDAIIVQILTDGGRIGFGEIQARPYVSGEDNESIWNTHAPNIAESIVGREVHSHQDVYDCLGASNSYQARPALIGGFDIAIIDALELEYGPCWTELFGPPRSRGTTKCLTIGQDYSGDDLKSQARLARLGGYGVVKLKVSGVQDVIRVQDLRSWLGAGIAIRLDANGMLEISAAYELLEQCANCDIESIEEPIDKATPNLAKQLAELHESTGIALMADESICTEADLSKFEGLNAYQIVNVRVGKCGGIQGTARLLRAALRAGFSVVSGTMVGETSVMLRTSRVMLAHCDDLRYIEGIDQSKKLLKKQSLIDIGDDPMRHFDWLPEFADKYTVGRKIAK